MAEVQKIQDDITLTLHAQNIIVHDTVRINVAISAQVDPSKSETDFRTEIQTTLHKFINTEWNIQSIQRSKGNKYESVYVNATTRVSENENYQLSERANAVSRIGFELINPNVDYSLSFDQIQDINSELRIALIDQALYECSAFNQTFVEAGFPNPHYRLSSTRFDVGNSQQNVSNSPHGNTAYGLSSNMMMNDETVAGAMAVDGSPVNADLNVSTRFSMIGTFILRSVHNA